jgi:hypothetical protein
MKEAYCKAMALADGELDSNELPALVQELARDPALLRAAQSFIDLRRNRFAKLYAGRREARVPQRLLDAAATSPMGRVRRSPSALQFGRALFGRLREEYRLSGFSLAAGVSVVAAVAVAVGWVLAPAPASDPALSPQVQAALEDAAGSRDTSVPGMRLLLTYWSKNQTWCRQFDIASGSRQTSAVACRQDGQWRVVLQTPPAPSGVLAPASSPRMHLDQFVRSHMNVAPLAPAQAQRTIDSGWEPPPGGG